MSNKPDVKVGDIIIVKGYVKSVTATIYYGPDFCEGWDGWEVDCKDSDGHYLYAKWIDGQWCLGMPY